jgi:hypothetical protein
MELIGGALVLYLIYFFGVLSLPYVLRFLGWVFEWGVEGLILAALWLWGKAKYFCLIFLKWIHRKYSPKFKYFWSIFLKWTRGEYSQKFKNKQREEAERRERASEALKKLWEEEERKKREAQARAAAQKKRKARPRKKSFIIPVTVAEAVSVLRLKPGYDDKALNKIYRRRMMTAHPDLGGDKEEAQAVIRASEIIKAAKGW